MKHPLRSNPPWVDHDLGNHWDDLVDAVGVGHLPDPSSGSFLEFGCGTLGCVLPTRRDGVVLKITTDEDEARFVSWAMGLSRWPQGIVRYHAAVRLGPSAHPKHRGATAYALWRESAWGIGEPVPKNEASWTHDQRTVADSLGAWMHLSAWARRGLAAPGGHRPQVIARTRELLSIPLNTLDNSPLGGAIAHALRFYLERGAVLSDSNLDNFGYVERPSGPMAVITDPSRVIFLDDTPPLPPQARHGRNSWREFVRLGTEPRPAATRRI